VFGLTGSLGAGKSTVAGFFRDLGATVLSADEAARSVTAKGTEVLRRISEAFGPGALTDQGELDRAFVAARVFTDSEARRKLEEMTHPAILELLRVQVQLAIEEARGPVVIEAPLLYEAGMAEWFDAVIVVTAPEEASLRRLRERGFAEAEAKQRLAAQMPQANKAARANFVLRNDGDLDELRSKTAQLWSKLRRSERAS
jgi:dephospho-CoA kinase